MTLDHVETRVNERRDKHRRVGGTNPVIGVDGEYRSLGDRAGQATLPVRRNDCVVLGDHDGGWNIHASDPVPRCKRGKCGSGFNHHSCVILKHLIAGKPPKV